MATELRTIVDGLNDEPFKMNLNLISLDAVSNEQLLQILSDVLLWIEELNTIDIREEGADVTALRIFNSLRVLKYRPPADIEKLQQWRCNIVEGEKTVIYPILEWIFKNVDVLKERAYLAKYLTKTDVPGAFQDPEVVELSNQISTLMEEFKEVHSQVIEARKDSLLMANIQADLNAMKIEKEQLSKRTDKIEHKLHGIANVDHLLWLAEKCRLENEQLEKVGHLRLEQKNLILFNDQKLQRLNVSLEEVKAAGENVDPTKRMKALKEEVETNRYMVNEKLPKEIEAKRALVADLSKVVDIATMDKSDIVELQQKIEKMNQEIMGLIDERDRKDENTDKLSIYRHQASAIYKKKTKLVEKLQEARSELQNITNKVEAKKNNLREKGGTDFVITTTQFKNYVNKLRIKTSDYKRKHAEINDLKSEHAILSRTTDILANQWKILMQKIEENGEKIIEIHNINHDKKSETAKSEINDVKKLRDMISESNQQMDLKRTAIDALKQSNTELNKQLTDAKELFDAKKRNYDATEANFESEFREIEENVKSMENEMVTKKRKIFRAEIEIKIMKTISEKLRQEGLRLVNQIEKEISRVNKELEVLRRSDQGNGLSVEEATAQVAMWRSLMKIFQLKLQIAEEGNTYRM
uniref:Intraflagellar transport protein 81 homolog n=1 Tax=Onchocerca volvulus TaxID=6282 RepID=A0A8R1XUZ8_ONCVO